MIFTKEKQIKEYSLSLRQSKMEKTKQEFEEWRSKNKRGRIPKKLWNAAVELQKEYTTSEISKVLRLDYNKLKNRVLGIRKNERENTAKYIQLDITQPNVNDGEWAVEIEKKGGGKLKISGKATSMSEVILLCQNFLRENS